MKKYLRAQWKKIEIDKWCEGYNLNRDPGQEYILQWIFQNGTWFRQAWENSLCKSCAFPQECGHELQQECNKYKSSAEIEDENQ